jgi:translation elongation factor P/translation initiation factor 5A
MKIKELKKMIKSAFIAENSIDDDAALQSEYDFLDEAEEKSLDDILADIMGTENDPYMAEDLSEAEEEGDEPSKKAEVDSEELEDKAEEETTDGGEEKSDSIVVDKRIVSLSSLPGETRKILDSLETLRAQAEEFGDQKFITQVGNTITFFTRDFVVAGDEPTKAKVDETSFPMWNKIK